MAGLACAGIFPCNHPVLYQQRTCNTIGDQIVSKGIRPQRLSKHLFSGRPYSGVIFNEYRDLQPSRQVSGYIFIIPVCLEAFPQDTRLRFHKARQAHTYAQDLFHIHSAPGDQLINTLRKRVHFLHILPIHGRIFHTDFLISMEIQHADCRLIGI